MWRILSGTAEERSRDASLFLWSTFIKGGLPYPLNVSLIMKASSSAWLALSRGSHWVW